MPDIMIRCPIHRVVISTGVSADVVEFDTLPDCAIPLVCPACEEVHYWRPHDAWVFGRETKKPRPNGKAHV